MTTRPLLSTRLALTVILLSVAVPAASAPADVPQLLEELSLPTQVSLPTCAASVDHPSGSDAGGITGELVIGQESGHVAFLLYRPSDRIVLTTPVLLTGHGPVNDLCTLMSPQRSRGAGTSLVLGLRGSVVNLVSYEAMDVVARATLPAPAGAWSLGVLEASQAAFAWDADSVWSLRPIYEGGEWRLEIREIPEPSGMGDSEASRPDAGLSPSRAVAVFPARDRILVFAGNEIREIVPAGAGFDTRVSTLESAVPVRSVSCVGERTVVCAAGDSSGSVVTLLARTDDGLRVASTLRLDEEIRSVKALGDSSFVLGGSVKTAWGYRSGWLAVVGDSGEMLAEGEHPAAVGQLTVFDGLIAVHGDSSNLSIYDRGLHPLWDHSSPVALVSMMARDFDGDGGQDVAVVGVAREARSRSMIDSMRVRLGRPDILEGAVLRRDSKGVEYYYRRQGNATLFLGGAQRLREILRQGSADARARINDGDADGATRELLTARAAAASLGLKDDVAELTTLLGDARTLPGRSALAFAAAVGLAFCGLVVSFGHVNRGLRRLPVVTWSIVLLCAAAVVWVFAGATPRNPLLPIGGLIPLAALAVGYARQRSAYAELHSGSAVEELSRRIMGFIHGGGADTVTGEGSRVTDAARKNIAQLAYLAEGMLDSIDDPERYETLKSVLAERAAAYRRLVLPETRELAQLGREVGFVTDPLGSMEREAVRISAALDWLLGEDVPRSSEFGTKLQELRSGRKELVAAAEAVKRAVQLNPGCSLNSVLDDTLTLRSELLQSSGIEVVRRGTLPEGGDAVRGARGVLFTIIENLVTNAVRAMDSVSTRTLTIRVTGGAGDVRVEFTDTGTGVAADLIDTLFVEDADASEGGFGLPYTRRVLRELGGDIVVESAPGRGSTFTLTLPFWMPNVGAGDDQDGRS